VEREGLELTLERFGTYGNRNVRGWRYVSEDSPPKWHIRTWPLDGDPIEEYWVLNGVFCEFFQISDKHGGTGRVIVIEDERKKTAILDAIKKWEGQIAETSST
jgi:hypothetical protein